MIFCDLISCECTGNTFISEQESHKSLQYFQKAEDVRKALGREHGPHQASPSPMQSSVSFHKIIYQDWFIIFSPQCQSPSGVHHLRGAQVEQPCSICNGSLGSKCTASLYSDSFGNLPVERNSDFINSDTKF